MCESQFIQVPLQLRVPIILIQVFSSLARIKHLPVCHSACAKQGAASHQSWIDSSQIFQMQM